MIGWSQVLQVDRENQHPNEELPEAYFMVLLYYHCDCHGERCDLLVISRSKVNVVMHLTHSHLLESHIGPNNTLEQIWDWFH